jgi:hypothetical protein
MKIVVRFIMALALILASTESAMAYIGPGAGVTFLGAFIGMLIAVFTAFGILLFWPIRRLIRKARANKPVNTDSSPGSETGSDGV